MGLIPPTTQSPSERNMRFFEANPDRRHYCRMAGEVEETRMRNTLGMHAPGWPLLAVRMIGAGNYLSRLIVIPEEGAELLIPEGEAACRDLFETDWIGSVADKEGCVYVLTSKARERWQEGILRAR